MTPDAVPDVVGLPLAEAEKLLGDRPRRSVATAPPPKRSASRPARSGSEGGAPRSSHGPAGARSGGEQRPAARGANRVLRQHLDERGTVILTIAAEAASDSEER